MAMKRAGDAAGIDRRNAKRPRGSLQIRIFFTGLACYLCALIWSWHVGWQPSQWTSDWLPISMAEDFGSSDHREKEPESGFLPARCPPEVRVEYLRQMCGQIRNSPFGAKALTGPPPPHLPHMTVSEGGVNASLGCITRKAGSQSWRAFLEAATNVSTWRVHSYQRELMASSGQQSRPLEQLRVITDMPSDSVAVGRYGNHVTYLTTRHPLQRVISAFFEVIMRLGWHRKPDGSKVTFTEYIDLVSGRWVEQDVHWMNSVRLCALCHVPYSAVIRVETMTSDAGDFRELIGAHHVMHFPEKHRNTFLNQTMDFAWNNRLRSGELFPENLGDNSDAERSAVFAYDRLLGELQKREPHLMDRLLEVYATDMALLGYHWDKQTARSSCRIPHKGSYCC